MAKKIIDRIKEDIDAIMDSTLVAKDKDEAIKAYFALRVQRNEDITEKV